MHIYNCSVKHVLSRMKLIRDSCGDNTKEGITKLGSEFFFIVLFYLLSNSFIYITLHSSFIHKFLYTLLFFTRETKGPPNLC